MCIETIGTALTSASTAVWQFVNSNIIIAFAGGFAGAIGGALSAQRIVERSRKRQERLKELRYTNAAIMVAHTICNSALSLKKQHVKPMRDQFHTMKGELKTFMAKRDAGEIDKNEQFHFQMDMRTYPALTTPIETLKHITYQEISAVGRPLALVSVIEQSLIGLEATIEQRGIMIKRFESGHIPANLSAQYYFGLPLPDGSIHQEYPDIIEAISSYTDDIAYFSYQLCKDLMKHGAKVKEALNKKTSKHNPNVSEADFSGPVKSGLMPPDKEYENWMNAFVEIEE